MDNFNLPHDHHPPHLFAVGSDRDACGPEPHPPWYELDDAWALSRRSDLFTDLIAEVGGAKVLAELDAEPLPDEPFDWSVVDERDAAFVAAVLAEAERCCVALLDTEFRTIARRILARVAARDPRALRRSTNVPRCAAGLIWLVGRANGEFGNRCRLPSGLLWDWFGVTDASDRGRGLWRAAALEPDEGPATCWPSRPTLGDASLLHSRYRAELIARRDMFVGIAAGGRSLSRAPDGQAHVRAQPLKPVIAAKGIVGNRVMIFAGFGDDLDDATFYAFSIPEARELVGMLRDALASPMPRSAESGTAGTV